MNNGLITEDQAAGLKEIMAYQMTNPEGFEISNGYQILDKNGNELTFIPAESQGVRSLQLWPLDDENGIWT